MAESEHGFKSPNSLLRAPVLYLLSGNNDFNTLSLHCISVHILQLTSRLEKEGVRGDADQPVIRSI